MLDDFLFLFGMETYTSLVCLFRYIGVWIEPFGGMSSQELNSRPSRAKERNQGKEPKAETRAKSCQSGAVSLKWLYLRLQLELEDP